MVNAFEPLKMDGIVYIPGRPRQYRADCKAGVFKIGESKLVGNELKLEILSFRTFEEQLFNYPYQSWLEIIFVDPDNIVGHILLKTESLDNFINLHLDLGVKGIAIGTGIVTAKMDKRSSELGTYYAVEFEWAENQEERVEELKAFIGQHQLYAARMKDGQVELPPLPAAARSVTEDAEVEF
ncbi:hypothetical protein [Myxosarcina sp. GI1]|uniref:hypothetical protein n=1 Tax=Myxosarcina sp. GI1 TaxID=1541065 RepID=UPI000567CE24|nr:hypothetical protein [Myxosarcina sp. GI1]